jgi:pimeloyl-ACP methyl ester carboxylesterase
VLLAAFAFLRRDGGNAPDDEGGSRFRHEMGGRTIEVGGLRVSYVEKGSGDPMVLLHGLGGCIYDWRHQLVPFAQAGHRAIAIDLPGAGLSAALPQRDYRIASIADHLAKTVRAIAGGPVTVVGNSYGGLVALAFAIRNPELVKNLVLVDAVSYEQGHPYFVPLFRIPTLPEVLTPALPVKPLLRRVLRGAVADPACIPDEVIDEYAREIVLPGRRESIIEIVRSLVREDSAAFAATIPAIRAATFVLWGELDTAVPLANGRRLAREIPGAALLVIPNCGHLPHVEFPELFRRSVLDFLRRS